MNIGCQKLEAYFHVLLGSVNDAVTGVDSEGIVLYWNESAERMYDIPKEHIIGKRIGDFFQRGSVMLVQVMDSGNPVRQVYHKPRPDMHVFITAVPVHDDQGELIGAISIEQDITHVVKLKEELFHKSEEQTLPLSSLPLLNKKIPMQQNSEFISEQSVQSYPLLLIGETGVGKRSLTNMVHHVSKKTGPFITISCSTIPSGLMDSELFGFQENFDSSHLDHKRGKLELAKNGTIYLKNVEALSLSAQEKLFTVLQEKQFVPVGGATPISLDCRIIASSTPVIEECVEKGTFLKELFYSFHTKFVPSLKDRKEDLPELCHLFLSEAALSMGKPVPILSSEVMTALTTYDWPGNLIQLRNIMEHLIIVSKGEAITLQDLPVSLRIPTLTDIAQHSLPLSALSEEMERAKIGDALQASKGNKAKAARLLGISRGSLYYKMKQYGFQREEEKK